MVTLLLLHLGVDAQLFPGAQDAHPRPVDRVKGPGTGQQEPAAPAGSMGCAGSTASTGQWLGAGGGWPWPACGPGLGGAETGPRVSRKAGRGLGR